MTRRFEPCEPFQLDGITFRIVRGEKPQQGTGALGLDLRVDWYSEELHRWVPITMRTAGFLADFLFENEGVLYPPEYGFQGGGKFKQFLWDSMKYGYQRAWAGVELEKRTKRNLFDQGDAA